MKNILKIFAAFVLISALLLSLTACGLAPSAPSKAAGSAETETRSYTDSVDRTVELPVQIDRIALSGPATQIYLFALCPDRLVGIAEPWSSYAEEYLDPEYLSMPVLGQLYGGKGELNLETLLSSGAQVVVDIGEPKSSIVEDLNSLQEQTGIPFVHINSGIAMAGDTYRELGRLLNMQDEAETLAQYCDRVYARAADIAGRVDKVKLLYITGDKGLNVIAKGSFHAETIDLMSDNLAVLDDPSAKGIGNEVDFEQILSWNPDYILFEPDSVYSAVGEDPLWQNINAIKNGTYYEVPHGPYNWMGFPPSVQRLLGMMWTAKLFYSEQADYDLQAEVTEYYRLFYHCNLTSEQYTALVADSTGKQ